MQIIQKSLFPQSNAYLKGYVREADSDSQHFKFPAVIIVPGGSFTHISDQQAESFALSFAAQGYQSFYLRYSFDNEKRPLMPNPLIELGQSVDYLKQHAVDLNIDPNQIIVCGFSIGGFVVSSFNNQYDDPEFINRFHPQNDLTPKAVILSYPVIDLNLGFPKDPEQILDWEANPKLTAAENGVTRTNVPTFIWHTADDPFVPAVNSLKYAEALAANQIDYELHVFHHGRHGMAMANQLTAWNNESNDPHVAEWFKLAIEWLNQL
ncbi:alpha/beta hydrolase [Nicoliella spurrieriana]|uniref:Alpha/beta hydrolase n=1 Tax=Nicoliella spurrieriana TaxID=2925830 RepID=A0A976RR98_9LACO|nr:alpha/beta hydrolase [Nicoliella spurrieriana]UQS86334.1 alpha/beta hydrolase [Nicoliella spurrieriana]